MGLFDRLALLPLLICFVGYPVAAWPILRWASGATRVRLLAGLNIAGLVLLVVSQTLDGITFTHAAIGAYLRLSALYITLYMLLIVLHFFVVSWSMADRDSRSWSAFLFPIAALCLIKYLPEQRSSLESGLTTAGELHRTAFFVGISYVVFRLAHFTREVHNDVVAMPGLAQYVSYALFLPVMSIGPITPFSQMEPALTRQPLEQDSRTEALLRTLIGLTKYLFLATVLNHFTYAGLLLDGHPHRWLDLFIAIPAYTLYLYCNFSGFCDMVIGVSALLGFPVSENFDRPFAARNLQEFWNRWHITLSLWFRDMMFTPLVKTLGRGATPTRMNHVVAFVIAVVFFSVGLWHGTGLNFILFGLLQAVGLITVHYYRIFLRNRVSRDSLRAYQENRWIRAAATTTTFAYFSLTLFFFANTPADMKLIYRALHPVVHP